MKTITAANGTKIEVRENRHYTVVAKFKPACQPAYIQICPGNYLNYADDLYIGKDDEDGRANGHRFYVDGCEQKQCAEILAVMEDHEAATILIAGI